MSNKVDKSLIIPIYGNEGNIFPLIEAINTIVPKLTTSLEVVFVVDGSPDRSYELLKEQTENFQFHYQIISLSRNFGSFTAIRTGMEHAVGTKIAVMAADLQEPIELIVSFFEILDADACDIVFGERTSREDSKSSSLLSNLYWKIYRAIVQPDIPKGGVDIFACNNIVREAVLNISEPNSSLVAQLFWVGFRRAFIPYERKKRQIGKSSWSFKKRLKYMLDSIFSFTDFPIMAVLWLGSISLLISILLGFVTFIAKLSGFIDTPGYSATTILLLFFGSTILTTQGIIGCYLWRTFENTKRRPLSLIEKHDKCKDK